MSARGTLKDESHLPVSDQSLMFRLLKEAKIRRQNRGKKNAKEGRSDKIADLLEESAKKIQELEEALLDVPEKNSALMERLNRGQYLETMNAELLDALHRIQDLYEPGVMYGMDGLARISQEVLNLASDATAGRNAIHIKVD